MTSINNKFKHSFKTTLSIFSMGLLLLSNFSVAQNSSELANLVFQPVLLSSAGEAALSLNGLSPNDEQLILDSISTYKTTIESSSSAAVIVEQLGLLAVAYQRVGLHDDAIDALEQAISVTVENGGQDNVEQLPLQAQKIPSYIALNDTKRVDDIEEFIYSLNSANYAPGSMEMYYATTSLADWNTAAYYRENFDIDGRNLKRQRSVISKVTRSVNISGPGGDQESVEANANSETGVSSGSDMMSAIFNGSVKNVSNQDVNASRLRKVDGLYEDFQEAHYASENPQLNVVIDMAQRIARLAFATKQEMDFERDNYTYIPNYEGSREQAIRNDPKRLEESYESGRDALSSVISTLQSVQGVRKEVVATALLDLADWHLAYGKTQSAKDTYAEATQSLLEAGFSSENINVALASELPMQIPLFAAHLHSKSSTGISPNTDLTFKGYLDVSYSINQMGNAENISVQNSAEGSSAIERSLKLQLKSMNFRPALRNGETISQGPVSLRYYYSY